jgi:ABC-2 type transport system permease protein
MRATLLIARRELAAYLRSMTGYVIAALFLFIDGILFQALAMSGADKLSSQVLAAFFEYSGGMTMFASVFISMRLLAEERQTGTLVLLTSSPVHDWEIILGKFLSAFAFLAMIIVATLYIPALIFVNGKVSFGHMTAGYLGLLLLGSASIAVGTFGSALARTQVLAVIFSGCMMTALVICWLLARVTERPFTDVFQTIALWQKHFPPFQAGQIHLRDVFFYLALTYLGLFAATRVMEARRWR